MGGSASAADHGLAPGKRTLTEALDPGPVQRKASAAPSAAPGPQTSAASGGLPGGLREKMESSFNADFSAVRVHEGPEAAAMGAVAFTQGSNLHFAPGRYDPESTRGQELIGHELAHVVQQSQGRVQATTQAKGAAINDDTGLEREADEMGARAARGEPAGIDGGRAAPAGSGVVQRYVEQKISSVDWRVADDLTMAIRQDSPVYGSRFFYAEPGLIKSSSDVLKKQSSHLEMKAGSATMNVTSTDGKTTKSLSRVEPANKSDGTAGNAKTGMQWPEDCGEAANSVMQGSDRKTRGVLNGPPAGFLEKIIAFLTGKTSFQHETKSVSYGTDTEKYKGQDFYSPHIMLDEIFKIAMNEKDAAKAWAKYQALSPADKDKFDQQVGINKYAQAQVGEAYSIVANKDEFLAGGSAWNFHWGGVVMRSGGDSVTLENFANSGTDAWDYQMYGPPTKAGQTFHEQQEQRMHGATPEYGANPTTIRVKED